MLASKSSIIIYLKDSSKDIEILGTMINQGKSSHKYLLDSSLFLSLSFSFSLSSKPGHVRFDMAVVQRDLLPIILI